MGLDYKLIAQPHRPPRFLRHLPLYANQSQSQPPSLPLLSPYNNQR